METGCLLHCLEVEETNVFEAVKQSVTTRQAALVYGISVGRNGMACCPFHDDRHPSMKVDRRFHCFACQADGDVIDFTSRLFGLSSKEAALKLAEDFSISFDRKGHDPPQKRVIKRKISEEMKGELSLFILPPFSHDDILADGLALRLGEGTEPGEVNFAADFAGI